MLDKKTKKDINDLIISVIEDTVYEKIEKIGDMIHCIISDNPNEALAIDILEDFGFDLIHTTWDDIESHWGRGETATASASNSDGENLLEGSTPSAPTTSDTQAMKARMVLVDPPQGWLYGFPKNCPREIVEDPIALALWLRAEGYPLQTSKDIEYIRFNYSL